MVENIGAATVALCADDLREIEYVAAHITVKGARYPEHLERHSGLYVAQPGMTDREATVRTATMRLAAGCAHPRREGP